MKSATALLRMDAPALRRYAAKLQLQLAKLNANPSELAEAQSIEKKMRDEPWPAIWRRMEEDGAWFAYVSVHAEPGELIEIETRDGEYKECILLKTVKKGRKWQYAEVESELPGPGEV